jgi:esterase/lipase superfamily enzyme/Tfp pilus assembly protein PilF
MRAVIWFVFAVSLAFPAMGGSVPAQSSDEIDSLNRQVEELHAEGKNAEALPMAERYVALTRQRYGEESAEFATAITWLGSVYDSQGRYSEAEALLKRALLIRESVLGPDHAQVGTSLSNLATLYRSQGRNANAEPLMKRSLSIREKGQGSDEFDALYRQIQERQWNGNTAEAIPLAERYVARVRERYGEEHPEFATAISLLGSLYGSQGRYAEAEALLERALSTREKVLGPDDPQVASSLYALAALYKSVGRTAEAEPLYSRARAIQDRLNQQTQFAVVVDPSYAVVKVYYVTDRKKTTDSNPAKIYAGDRGELAFGICTVSIPRDHRMGEMEAPSVWRLELSEDPEQHVVLLSVMEKDKSAFYQDVASRIRKSAGKNAFVFVHGYNVTFADAARRTAQMAYDLGFDGAPVFYSWPSQASYASYGVDETNAEWSQVDLENFLKDFAEQSEADNIFLIAHSMGARVLTGALKELLAEDPQIRSKLKEIILAAPDIDADTFKRDIAPRILTTERSATLYASSGDYALTASKNFAGYRRAGDTAGGVTVVEGLDTIDASNIRTDFIGHSYYGDSDSVLGDIRNLILYRKRAEERSGLTPVDSAGSRYWALSH